MVIVASIGAGIFFYGVFHTFLTCICDCDLRLKFAEILGKNIGALQGKVIWVVGASSGIGEHLSLWLARGGAKLVLSSRRRDELVRVKQACHTANPILQNEDILILPMDILEIENHKVQLNEVLRHFGNLDILVNNAGRSQRASWEEVNTTVDRQLFELNVFSVVALSRVVLAYFAERSPKMNGQIVVTSSLAGLVGFPFSPSYTGSKHALQGYFESLRSEKMGSNLKITMLCPGPTFTNFLNESFTGVPGEKLNQAVKETDRRMSADRCGQLCAIAIANELYEGWMALFPILPIVYIALYFPNLTRFAFKMMGPEGFQRLRDSRDTVPTAATK